MHADSINAPFWRSQRGGARLAFGTDSPTAPIPLRTGLYADFIVLDTTIFESPVERVLSTSAA